MFCGVRRLLSTRGGTLIWVCFVLDMIEHRLWIRKGAHHSTFILSVGNFPQSTTLFFVFIRFGVFPDPHPPPQKKILQSDTNDETDKPWFYMYQLSQKGGGGVSAFDKKDSQRQQFTSVNSNVSCTSDLLCSKRDKLSQGMKNGACKKRWKKFQSSCITPFTEFGCLFLR